MSADQLLAIIRSANALSEDEVSRRDLSCPFDGTPYSASPTGELRCRFDGYSPTVVTTPSAPGL